jgi:menaquinone-dependent protoporphyrinogen oxidase
MTRTLILYATAHGQTSVVAQAIADRLCEHRIKTRMVELDGDQNGPDLTAFNLVVLGSSNHFGKLDSELRAYVNDHRVALAAVPVFLFSVGVAADPGLARWCKQQQLVPRATAAFAGAPPYRSSSPVTRLLTRISGLRGDRATELSRDSDFPNRGAVARFADDMARAVVHVRDVYEEA